MRRSNIIFNLAILLIGLISTGTVFADVKIKARQTVSGQSYENTTFIKGKRMRTEQNMGGMQTINLTQCDLKRGVRIMPAAQTYMIDLWNQAQTTNAAPVSTTGKPQMVTKGGVITMTYTTKDTGERKQMVGYTAKHLITTMETNPSPDACNVNKSKMQIDGWYIDAAFVLNCQNDQYASYQQNSTKGGCQDRYDIKQVGAPKTGYPVWEKMTMFDDGGKESFSMLNEVVELSNATLDAALFDVPSGYREVKDSTELYTSMASNQSPTSTSTNSYIANSTPSDTGMSNNVQSLSRPTNNSLSTTVGEKKAGVIRFGLADVKTGSVGEGLSAAELAGAVRNTLLEYLKAPNIEIVALEAKLPSAIETEAKSKDCDYVIFTNVSHKKGGGFGMFKKIAPALGSVVPMAGISGRVAGQVAGQITSTAIYTAAGMAGNVKAKDEVTLDVKVNVANGASAGGATVLAKQFKRKAQSDGDDIISPVIEQAAQAVIDTTTRK